MKRLGLLGAFFLLVLPASALGATRYASPGGGAALGCPQLTPCSLASAITGAAANDEVIVTPGTYSVAATIEPTVPLTIEGQPGQPRPRIAGAPGVGPLKSFEALTLRNLRIEGNESLSGVVFAPVDGNVFDHLELIASGEDALVLRPGNNFTLTNSLLLVGGESSGAVEVQGTANGTPVLRNDTIVASGPKTFGIDVAVTNTNTTVTVAATNVIADAALDASAHTSQPGSSGAIVFDHSNFDTVEGVILATSSQSAPPVFVDAPNGDYREAVGSPTIDGGVNDAANGVTDLAGDPRVLPGSPGCPPPPAVTDIGAYEYVPATATCLGPPRIPPLQTNIAKAKIHGRNATFRFGGSGGAGALGFECKLDRKPWRLCSSPKKYRHLKLGRHAFRVRASSAGVVDTTPAKWRFKIKRPHRPRHHG